LLISSNTLKIELIKCRIALVRWFFLIFLEWTVILLKLAIGQFHLCATCFVILSLRSHLICWFGNISMWWFCIHSWWDLSITILPFGIVILLVVRRPLGHRFVKEIWSKVFLPSLFFYTLPIKFSIKYPFQGIIFYFFYEYLIKLIFKQKLNLFSQYF
jgi:hypothetical protein